MIITLCGSTKFKEQYQYWNKALSLRGALVFSVASLGHQPGEELTQQEKATLDVVHLNKICASDCIFVVTGPRPGKDATPYIGESTQREIMYAQSIGKPVYYDHQPQDIAKLYTELNK